MKAKTELPKNERSEFKEEFLDQLIERTISRTNRLIKVSKLTITTRNANKTKSTTRKRSGKFE